MMKIEAPLPPPLRTLPQMLRRGADAFGEAPAVSCGEAVWTHREVAKRAASRAAALRDAGVGRGEAVAVMSGNRPEFLEAFVGCAWLGAVCVPINTASRGPQIEYFLVNSKATLLVIEAQYLERLDGVDLEATPLKAIWVVGDASALPSAGDARVGDWPPGGNPVGPAEVRPGDPLAILYTSGTTGPSKGVLCSHAQYFWWGVNSVRVLDVTRNDVLCTMLPLFHVNALNTLAQAVLVGCQAVFVSRFSASGFWPTIRSSGATVVYLLGAMVPILLAQPPSTAEREHRVRTGLGPGVPGAAGQEFFHRTGVRLLEGYGSTETNFVIATTAENRRPGVMGWVLPGFEAAVVDEEDAELPPGEPGELVLRANEPFAFASGYFGMPDKTVEAWRNLWFHTGDRVLRHADGAFQFVDRIKDAIRRRGENISSYEVEQALLSHEAVAEVAVYPVRSELAEDEVMAAVVCKPEHTVSPEALVEWCIPRLPGFSVPRFFDILTELPRTENGKVQKYKLRERGVTAGTWERIAKTR
jgi:crotonobetaine/carnitine-CoA ligase